MVLFVTVLFTVLSYTAATNFRHVYPRPFSPRSTNFARGQIGLLEPRPVSRITPRILPRLPPSKSVVWIKKFDPRTGAWIKVMKGKRNVFGSAVHHHFAKKAHIARKLRMNNIIRARNLVRINNIRGGLLAVARQRDEDDFPRVPARILGQRRGGGYRRYNRKPKRMNKIRPRDGTGGILGQRINRQFNPLWRNRRPHLRRNINLRSRDDGDFFDDFMDNDRHDFEDFNEIDDSFDDRFDGGFRNTHSLLNSGSNLVRADIRGRQISVPQKPLSKPKNPSIVGDVAGFPRKGYYSKMNSIPRTDINTIGTGGAQTGAFKPSDRIRNNLNTAILGTFDRKRKVPFQGMRGIGDVRFTGMRGVSDAGILGSQQNGFDANNGDITGLMNEPISVRNRMLDSPLIPSADRNIRFPPTGVVGLAGDDRLPDGLLHDFGDVEDLSGIENRLDLVTDALSHLNDRLNLNERLDLDDRLDFDDRLNDRLGMENRFDDRLTQLAHVQSGVNDEILDKPHIAKAIDEFDRGDVDVEGDIGHLRHDESPIDGLELLGPSRWSDIITELTNAATHNQIFDQEPRESVPVFPVNPHSSAEPSTLGGNDVTTDRNNGLGTGSLALLGIDPGTFTTDHPPPIPLPEKSETMTKTSSLDSLTSTKIAVGDDSTQTILTTKASQNGNPASSKQFISENNVRIPTKDIASASEQMAMFGALDSLDFGNDSFDEDLRI
ncbi:uncharacterized protein LOC123547994 [Mercenaria mercenaria]|uniref:uncharacterized protein LOC123547994 n=1 Tax=Mercenaria mercenaria TaxID=6596 RepID=UPI00234F6740|nr:uncharacterized protein LOC123547994 [Mercenaria mercenaria]